MLSNFLITSIAMIILSFIISTIVSDYIEDGIAREIIEDNRNLVEMLSSRRFLKYEIGNISVDLDYLRRIQDLPVMTVVFDMSKNPKLINISTRISKEILSDNELENMYSQSTGQVYDIKIMNKSFLAYNESVQVSLEGVEFTFLVSTLISNENVKTIVNQIVYVLIIAIAIISILIVLINRSSERMITCPIDILVKTTENFALKHFDDKAVLHTGDEFEILATAINNMAESLKKQDVEQKSFMKIFHTN